MEILISQMQLGTMSIVADCASSSSKTISPKGVTSPMEAPIDSSHWMLSGTKRMIDDVECSQDRESFVSFLRPTSATVLLAQVAACHEANTNREIGKEQKRELEEAMHGASSIPEAIARALKDQMVYVPGLTSYTKKPISCTHNWASDAVFAAAFSVPIGTKTVVKTARELNVGRRCLRSGAFLECSDVRITLVGDVIVAKARYSLRK